MASIRKRGQKYQARIRHSGNQYEKSFTTYQSAEQWIDHITQTLDAEKQTTLAVCQDCAYSSTVSMPFAASRASLG